MTTTERITSRMSDTPTAEYEDSQKPTYYGGCCRECGAAVPEMLCHRHDPERGTEKATGPMSNTAVKIAVRPEGRDGVWLAEPESLKTWISAQEFESIHNFGTAGSMLIGADHQVDGVLGDIDNAERVAILTGESQKGNMSHALALIMPEGHNGLPERLEMYDIGPVTEADLDAGGRKPRGGDR